METSAPARVALRLLNYPAWRVIVNGRDVMPERPDDVNQMLIPVEAGKSEIDVRFARTTDRTAGLAISMFSLIACLSLLRARKSLEA